MRAAARLQSVKDSWQPDYSALEEALYFNRKLWTVLVSSVAKQENPLPDAIKQNIANLGVFIFQRTVELSLEPEASKVDILITINREIAAGLEGR